MRRKRNRFVCKYNPEAADLNAAQMIQDAASGVKRDEAAASSPVFTQAAASRFQQPHYADHISLLLRNNMQTKRREPGEVKISSS